MQSEPPSAETHITKTRKRNHQKKTGTRSQEKHNETFQQQQKTWETRIKNNKSKNAVLVRTTT